MRCPVEHEIVAYVDRQLDAGRHREVDRHLDGCARCQAAVAEMAGLLLSTLGTAPVDVSDDGRDTDDVGGRAIAQRYAIERRLGAGAMGEVFAAHDRVLERKVALKLLRSSRPTGRAGELSSTDVLGDATAGPDRRVREARLVREAQALARLHHPNIVEVFEIGAGEGGLCIVMELVAGETLRRFVARRAPSWREATALLLPAASALASAHDAGVVHRDFKPDNLMITATGIKVLDFGLARADDDPSREHSAPSASDSDTETRTGAMVGTPAYMAPECIDGATATAASDQYAFFTTLFEAICGVRPYVASSVLALRVAKNTRIPESDARFDGVPRWLRRVLVRGLDPDPARRFADMHEVVTALRRGATRRRIAAPVFGVAALLGAASITMFVDRAPAGCDPASVLDPIWNDATKRALFGRLSAATDAAGQSAFVDVLGYADRWTEAYAGACEESDPHARDLALGCLRTRLDLLATLVQISTDADRDTITAMIASLPPPTRCGEASPYADDALTDEQRAVEAELLGAFERGRLLGVAGKDLEVLALARDAAAEAEAHGLRYATGAARLLEGHALQSLARFAEAESALEAAFFAFRDVGDDAMTWQVASTLVYVVGLELQRHREALQWYEHAAVAMRRTGDDPDQSFQLQISRGLLHEAMGENDEALAVHRAALELATEPNDVAAASSNVGNTLTSLGRFAEATVHYQRALAVRREHNGPDHAETIAARLNYASNLTKIDRAEAGLQEAQAISRQLDALGIADDYPLLAGAALNMQGAALAAIGDLPAALAAYEQVLAVSRRVRGDDHPWTMADLVNVAMTEARVGRCDAALEHAADALAGLQGAVGSEDGLTALATDAHTNALRCAGRHDEALAHAEQAAALFAAINPAAPELVLVYQGMAEDLDALGRDDAAERARQRAVALAGESPD